MKRILIIVAVFGFLMSFGQETIIYNTQPSNPTVSRKTTDTIQLPFFDDFSTGELNASLWETNGVTVNINGVVFPPSIGAAMFDATDKNGDFYAKNYQTLTPSDTLCSKPINLALSGDNTVYLSFFYQPQGLLDPPEPGDSLVLQFFSPVDSSWTTVWKAGGPDKRLDNPQFKAVILNITDSKYLQNGFRFRFVNYTSLGSATIPSIVSDCDYWFIDYVYLNNNRYSRDTVFPDVALQYPADIKFDNYTAVPFSHYPAAYKHSISVNFRNNDAVYRTIDSLYLVFSNDNTLNDTLFLGSYSFPALGNFFFSSDNIAYEIPVTSQGAINVQTKLITDQYDPKQNNTANSVLYLSDFYAYDDGSAEAGYGLTGDGTFEALVAARFVTSKPDTLKAVAIYFNKTYNLQQPKYFYLMVWDNDNDLQLPGKQLYEQTGVEIDFNNLDNFQVFELDSPIVVSDTFYIGWKKTDEQLMNAGLDLNNTGINYKFFNIYGNWEESKIPGGLMIRPVFGNSGMITTNLPENQPSFSLYPNPASDIVHIYTETTGILEIYGLNGKILLRKNINAPSDVNLERFSPGVYVAKFISTDGHVTVKKLLVR